MAENNDESEPPPQATGGPQGPATPVEATSAAEAPPPGAPDAEEGAPQGDAAAGQSAAATASAEPPLLDDGASPAADPAPPAPLAAPDASESETPAGAPPETDTAPQADPAPDAAANAGELVARSEPEELTRMRAQVVEAIRTGAVHARTAGGHAWRRAKQVRPPRTVKGWAFWAGGAAGAVVVSLVLLFVYFTWDMPSTDDLWEAADAPSITFVDRNGTVILREGAQNAPPVNVSELPPYVTQAFVAIEDRRFYQHHGVDVSSLVRAAVENFRSGHVVQGGSTITQQLAKNLFLDSSRTFRRKVQEFMLAIWLETRFTKQEILALYLSRVYFGAGAWGIEAASERYFDRPARELTLLQAAMLAGIVKAPTRYNLANGEIAGARARAELVLNNMVDEGFISDAERQAALREELQIARNNPAGDLGYFRDYIDPQLNRIIGESRGDFVIETTLDIAAQRAGEAAVDAALERDGQSRRIGQAALVSLDDQGGVRAMIGGRHYGTGEGQSEFNRVTQARRQPGSSFKFFIYLAAMEAGLTPWTVRVDAPITIGDWTPANYNQGFEGPVQLVQAFARSLNMVAIIIANEAGGDRVIDVARRLGVTSRLENYRSLALGAQEVTLMEMTQSYGAMASGGFRIEPHGIARVRRANGEVMWSWRPRSHERVIQEQHLRFMNMMMNRVVEGGTGTTARINGRQLGGKTGTANDYRDAWFIGFTPGLVTGVWVGNDDHRVAMARVTGGQTPAQIWRDFMVVALRNVPARRLEMPTAADYSLGPPPPDQAEGPDAVASYGGGAPLGGGATAAPPEDEIDRSLDFGPDG